MSLSFDRGERKIAKVLSGKYKDKDIYLNTGESGNVGMLSKKFFNKYKKLKKSKAKKLKRALEWGERPEEEDLREIYDSAAEDIKKISRDKIKLDGKLSPVPQDGIIEKIYVSVSDRTYKPIMPQKNLSLLQAKTLVERLARLSADSIWARRASGLRASIDKAIVQIENGQTVDTDHFKYLISLGYKMLEKAGKEIPVPEDILFKTKGK